jgi:hypothetical protein
MKMLPLRRACMRHVAQYAPSLTFRCVYLQQRKGVFDAAKVCLLDWWQFDGFV